MGCYNKVVLFFSVYGTALPAPSVNDLGGDRRGGGKSSAMADEVVTLINQRGGVAVPNYGGWVWSLSHTLVCQTVRMCLISN